jgi:hypothetical protein
MQYLLLIYDTEGVAAQMPETEYARFMGEYTTLSKNLAATGKLVNANRLHDVAKATTVRVREGKAQLTDGPFAETREQLGGYYLINAKDLDEATKIAAQIPSARYGSIEVRPIMEM